MLTAIVLINVERKEVKTAIKVLSGIDGVKEIHAVAGEYDLVAIVKVPDNKQLADVIAEKINHQDCIKHTKTLFALDSIAT